QDSQILREIDFFLRRYPLTRGLYLAYDRIALFGRSDHEFRVTFDQNIRSRNTFMGLENGDEGELLLPEGYYLMECKVLGATPLWFTEILSSLAIYPISFSKYGNIYKKEIAAVCPEQALCHQTEHWNEMKRKQIC
ncbi:MAG: VTC domain-containing protein, partial [Pygmaiobacter sp.]